MSSLDQTLEKILADQALVSPEQLEEAKLFAQKNELSLQKALVSLDMLPDENLAVLLADSWNIPYINLSTQNIPLESWRILPRKLAQLHEAVVYKITPQLCSVATLQPTNSLFFHYLQKKAGRPLELKICSQRALERALQANASQNLTLDTTTMDTAQILDALFLHAMTLFASDIHLEPQEDSSIVRMRKDGALQDVATLPSSTHQAIIGRIKLLSDLRIDEHLSAQDGKMQQEYEGERVDIRVSIVPTTGGEKAVLRLLHSQSRQFSLEELGMSQSDLEKVRKALEKPYGMVLSTGPTGSGKTTTIYALVKLLNSREKNIATIEDPVEYEIEGVNQIQVNPQANLTFASGLRSILRQDPNVIFVGEIRDEETAAIAINSALTGHVVVSTLHANDAATTLPRLVEMKIEPYLVGSTVNIIVGQRLVRRLCTACRTSTVHQKEELLAHASEEMLAAFWGESKELRAYTAPGCEACQHTGFTGRVGLFEVLEVTPTIEKLLTQNADAPALRQAARQEGMTTLFEDGLRKVSEGATTLEEVLRAAKEEHHA